tara:strand:+ start:287 stop:487 length:201 start_codon:yes stop_codon:yes gene_type:complete
MIKMKYIVTDNGNNIDFFMFPMWIQHVDMCERIDPVGNAEVLGAGFVSAGAEDDRPYCHGDSFSLK